MGKNVHNSVHIGQVCAFSLIFLHYLPFSLIAVKIMALEGKTSAKGSVVTCTAVRIEYKI